MLNFVICDDDIYMLDKLSLLLEKAFLKYDFDAQIVLKTQNYNEIVPFMSANLVNVIILDIEFKNSKVNGLDVADKIRKMNKNCYIIFVTSHFEYIVEAYDYKTFAYIFKNSLSVDALSKILNRLFDDISGSTSKFIKVDRKGTFIDLNDIQFIEKNGMKLIYHNSRCMVDIYSSFSKIENMLPSNFVRCHKSYIANINNIAYISLADSSIYFKNGESCYIGPKYKNLLMEVIDYESVSK